jgi:hypothetical protein
MSAYLPIIIYVMVGFTIASFLAKFYPEYFNNTDASEPPGEVMFLICTLVWPIIFMYHVLKLPFKGLQWYLARLTDRSQ